MGHRYILLNDHWADHSPGCLLSWVHTCFPYIKVCKLWSEVLRCKAVLIQNFRWYLASVNLDVLMYLHHWAGEEVFYVCSVVSNPLWASDIGLFMWSFASNVLTFLNHISLSAPATINSYLRTTKCARKTMLGTYLLKLWHLKRQIWSWTAVTGVCFNDDEADEETEIPRMVLSRQVVKWRRFTWIANIYHKKSITWQRDIVRMQERQKKKAKSMWLGPSSILHAFEDQLLCYIFELRAKGMAVSTRLL